MKKLALIIVVIVIAGGVWLWQWQSRNVTPDENTQIVNNNRDSQQTYTNDKFGYRVQLPQDATISELSSGIEGSNDKGHIVDFNLNNVAIRITTTGNTRNDKTLEELIEVRNNIGMPLDVSDSKAYEKIQINSQPAFKYLNFKGTNETQQRTGTTILLLGKKYYYQIATGSQFTPEYTAERENIFDSFFNTFELIGP